MVKAIAPSVPPHVAEGVTAPAAKVGTIELATVLDVASVPVQLLAVIKKLLYVPADKPANPNALLLTVTVLGLPAPV